MNFIEIISGINKYIDLFYENSEIYKNENCIMDDLYRLWNDLPDFRNEIKEIIEQREDV